MITEGQTKKRILIAEDDPVSRHVLKSLLLKWSYEVTVVSDGAEALQILEREDAPRLAVLDWMMPGLEGVQVCHRIRKDTERLYTYVLLLTARDQKGDLLQALELGADDYLTKPFDATELRARISVGQRILDLQDGLIAAREELRVRATTDSLTGIANRAVAIDTVHREHSRQVRNKGSVGIILADLDHFKAVNDTYGHLCGDAVLREAARRMSSCTRTYDTVGRWGGEEFLIVVPSSDESGVMALAERIRRAIESEPVSTDSGALRITASFGVAVSTAFRIIDPDALLQLADEALYRAKDRGRNCSVSATSSDLESSQASPANSLPRTAAGHARRTGPRDTSK